MAMDRRRASRPTSTDTRRAEDTLEDRLDRPHHIMSSTKEDAMAKRDEKEEGAEVSLEELNNGATQPKHFSTMALLGLSYAILNTWGASSGSIYIGLGSGGPVSVVWGTVVGTLGALAIACSLAEMCQVIPTKGAQYVLLYPRDIRRQRLHRHRYHWCFSLADGRRSQRFLSYMSGWMGTAGWLALTSTAPFLTAQSIQINIQLFHPTFQPGPWFQFVLYMALSVYAALINAFGVRLMNSLNTAALFVCIRIPFHADDLAADRLSPLPAVVHHWRRDGDSNAARLLRRPRHLERRPLDLCYIHQPDGLARRRGLDHGPSPDAVLARGCRRGGAHRRRDCKPAPERAAGHGFFLPHWRFLGPRCLHRLSGRDDGCHGCCRGPRRWLPRRHHAEPGQLGRDHLYRFHLSW